MARALSDSELKLLRWLCSDDETGSSRAVYQWNTWAIPTDVLERPADLPLLKRRGLVGGEGRGRERQWWITEEGIEAVRARG